MLPETAAATHTGFVDVYPASAGHDVCAAPRDRWLDGSDPGGVNYHPNAQGMPAVAKLVESVVISGRDQPAAGDATGRVAASPRASSRPA